VRDGAELSPLEVLITGHSCGDGGWADWKAGVPMLEIQKWIVDETILEDCETTWPELSAFLARSISSKLSFPHLLLALSLRMWPTEPARAPNSLIKMIENAI
jgi:hypothetical protein